MNLSSSIDEMNSLNGNKNEGLGLAIAGLGCIDIAFSFGLSAKDHLHKSIDLYNANIKESVMRETPPPHFKLIVKANTLSIQMTF